MTNRNLFTTIILFFLCVCDSYSQSRIEQLLPLLIDCDSINAVEFMDNNIEDNNGSRNYVIIVLPTPIERIPQSIKDSLIAAFEHEYFIASESDRYHKRGKTGDTLSYALVYNRGYDNESGRKIAIAGDYSGNRYDARATANLDIKGKNLIFDFYLEGSPRHRLQLKNKYGLPSNISEEETRARIKTVFNEIAANSSVIKQSLCFDGSKNTCGRCLFQIIKYKKNRSKGTRLEVPPSIAEQAFAKMANAMNKATFTDCSHDFSRKKDDIDIIFGKDYLGEAFLMHRASDGRVYLFHKEAQEEGYGNDIPQNWYSEDYLK